MIVWKASSNTANKQTTPAIRVKARICLPPLGAINNLLALFPTTVS
jgi:hypothetical protein